MRTSSNKLKLPNLLGKLGQTTEHYAQGVLPHLTFSIRYSESLYYAEMSHFFIKMRNIVPIVPRMGKSFTNFSGIKIK